MCRTKNPAKFAQETSKRNFYVYLSFKGLCLLWCEWGKKAIDEVVEGKLKGVNTSVHFFGEARHILYIIWYSHFWVRDLSPVIYHRHMLKLSQRCIILSKYKFLQCEKPGRVTQNKLYLILHLKKDRETHVEVLLNKYMLISTSSKAII